MTMTLYPKHEDICRRSGLSRDEDIAGTWTCDNHLWRMPDALLEKIIVSVDPMELPKYAANCTCDAVKSYLLPILADTSLWQAGFDVRKTDDAEIDALREHCLDSVCDTLKGLWTAILEIEYGS